MSVLDPGVSLEFAPLGLKAFVFGDLVSDASSLVTFLFPVQRLRFFLRLLKKGPDTVKYYSSMASQDK